MSLVFCIIAARNERRFLPGFLSHISRFVDGIIGLDDGSIDNTQEVFAQEPKVRAILTGLAPLVAHGHETRNRNRLLLEARKHGATWVLCGDADERFETEFLRSLRDHISDGDRHGTWIRSLQLVNLWDSDRHFRVDGVCAPRRSRRMFRLPPVFSPRLGNELHQSWYPPELAAMPTADMDTYLYHLRMIHREDREMRWAKFQAADPNRMHQKIGYDHLVDERGLQVQAIPPGRGFEYC